jgi:Zn/Cd-binding protein ZinT
VFKNTEKKTDAIKNDIFSIKNIFLTIYVLLKKIKIEKIKEIKNNINNITTDKDIKSLLDKGYHIVIENNKYNLYNNNDNIGNFKEICEKVKKIPHADYTTDKIKKNKTTNQMLRIKDGRITATKMILMHLVSGQEYKHDMVKETIELTENLFNATNIKFNIQDTVEDVTLGGGNIDYKQKYLKYRGKYLRLKYN